MGSLQCFQDAFYSVDELIQEIVQRNPENRNRMTERLGPVFLDFLISGSLRDPFVQGQVCKTLNLMLRSTPQILRNNFFARHFDQVDKALKLLDSVGDFEVQV